MAKANLAGSKNVDPFSSTHTNVNYEDTLNKLNEAMGLEKSKKLVAGNESFGDLFSAELILSFKKIFKKSTSSENALSAAEFKDLMLNYMTIHQASLMYQQIDVNGDGFVQFS